MCCWFLREASEGVRKTVVFIVVVVVVVVVWISLFFCWASEGRRLQVRGS